MLPDVLVACMTYSLTLKKEALLYSETSVSRYGSCLCLGCLRICSSSSSMDGALSSEMLVDLCWTARGHVSGQAAA